MRPEVTTERRGTDQAPECAGFPQELEEVEGLLEALLVPTLAA